MSAFSPRRHCAQPDVARVSAELGERPAPYTVQSHPLLGNANGKVFEREMREQRAASLVSRETFA